MGKEAKAQNSLLRGRLDAAARQYYSPLLAFFRKRTRNSPEVEDLVQQVFYRLSRHLETGEVRNPDAYIFKTASNTLRDFRRKALVRERVIDRDLDRLTEAEEADSDFSPERVLISREAMDLAVVTLRSLPERTRDIFMLRCFEGLKHAEIARLQNISVRAVEKHVAKALAALSRKLERGHER